MPARCPTSAPSCLRSRRACQYMREVASGAGECMARRAEAVRTREHAARAARSAREAACDEVRRESAVHVRCALRAATYTSRRVGSEADHDVERQRRRRVADRPMAAGLLSHSALSTHLRREARRMMRERARMQCAWRARIKYAYGHVESLEKMRAVMSTCRRPAPCGSRRCYHLRTDAANIQSSPRCPTTGRCRVVRRRPSGAATRCGSSPAVRAGPRRRQRSSAVHTAAGTPCMPL